MRIALGMCAAALAAPAAAQADKTIEAQTVWRFDASTYMLDTGEKLTFKNDDAASPGPHNTPPAPPPPPNTPPPSARGAKEKPLFSSATIKNGEQAPVNGAGGLNAGR